MGGSRPGVTGRKMLRAGRRVHSTLRSWLTFSEPHQDNGIGELVYLPILTLKPVTPNPWATGIGCRTQNCTQLSQTSEILICVCDKRIIHQSLGRIQMSASFLPHVESLPTLASPPETGSVVLGGAQTVYLLHVSGSHVQMAVDLRASRQPMCPLCV